MKRGVITIYLAITFTVLLSLFLSAFQAARFSAYRVIAETATRCGILSAFGEYNRELLDRYDLLYIDLSYQTKEFSYQVLSDRVGGYINENLGEPETRLLFARDFFGGGSAVVKITDKSLATDLFGNNLKKQATEYMKDRISADFAEDLLSLIRIKKDYKLDEESFLEIKEKLDSEAKEALENNGEESNSLEETGTVRELTEIDWEMKFLTPLDYIVLKEGTAGVSGKIFNPLDLPSTRLAILDHSHGEFQEVESDPLADVYFTEYIVEKCGNYVQPKEDSYLRYEAEYVFAGQNNDAMNLKYTIRAIFFIRSAANLISLNMDEEKMKLVDSVAEVLSLISRVPAKVISGLILVLWAAGEATYDVRDLYHGDRVELIKDADRFYLSLQGGIQNMLSIDEKSIKALPGPADSSGRGELALTDETEIGSYSSAGKTVGVTIRLSYKDYLRMLIMMTPSLFKAGRMMDVIELDMRMTEGNEYFQLDWCLDGAVFEVVVTSSFGAEYELKRKYCY